MNEYQRKIIIGFYDQNQEYQKNEKFSDNYETVYTKGTNHSDWLVAIPRNNSHLEIHQTDEQGVIIARDIYESEGNKVVLSSAERLTEDGKGTVVFRADEINLIYQFGENTKEETLAMMKAMLPRIKETDTTRIVSDTIEKLSVLSPESVSKLVSSVKCCKIYERDYSIRDRLARAKKQVQKSKPKALQNNKKKQCERG